MALTLYERQNFNRSKLKVFADDKFKLLRMMTFVLNRVTTFLEKEKMLVASIFSFAHNIFKGFLSRVVKSRDCVAKS